MNSAVKCTERECQVLITGECVNGQQLNACPHVTLGNVNMAGDDEFEHDANEPIDAGDRNEESEKDYVNVFTADVLSSVECQPILSSSLTRVIVLAGKVNSGKTTLLATLFQLFQNNDSFAGFQFAGSKTLIGFERRCHESRIRSGLNAPATARTVRGAHRYLHLKVGASSTLTDILFTDISGEYFKDLSNSTEECKKFTLAKRADHFALFMDAEQLATPSLRQKAKAEGLAILRSLVEADMLSKDTHIQIIFSRWDLLLSKDNLEEHKQFVSSIKAEIVAKYRSSHPLITFFEVASRPKHTSGLSFGYGLEAILPVWVRRSKFINSHPYNNFSDKPAILMKRHFMKYEFS